MCPMQGEERRPFVGRTAEAALLRTFLDSGTSSTRRGSRRRLVVVSGPAGVGTTRFVEHVVGAHPLPPAEEGPGARPDVVLVGDLGQAGEATVARLADDLRADGDRPITWVCTLRAPGPVPAGIDLLPLPDLEITLGGLRVEELVDLLTDRFPDAAPSAILRAAHRVRAATGGMPSLVVDVLTAVGPGGSGADAGVDALVAASDAALAAHHAGLVRRLASHDATVPRVVLAEQALLGAAALSATELVTYLEQGADEAWASLAFDVADRLYARALDASRGLAGQDRLQLRLMLGRLRSLVRSGTPDEVARIAGATANLADRLGDADALAEAAVAAAEPVEWRAGDPAVGGLLVRAERSGPSDPWRARVLAARAVVEMRVPVAEGDGTQWSWITRPAVARPLVEEAVALAEASGDPAARLAAALSWRNLHRAPEFLTERRRVSAAASDLAQRLGALDLLVEAALRHATDSIEAADRGAFEESLALLAWAAQRSGSPRALWRRACLEACAAAIDGDVERLAARRRAAFGIGEAHELPGRSAVDAVLGGQELSLAGELGSLYSVIRNGHPVRNHPMGLAWAAWISASVGDADGARRLLDALPRPLDREASLLATCSIAGRAAARAGDPDTVTWLLGELDPWRSHVAVDSECLVVPGPVALVTAELRAAVGDHAGALEDHRLATALNRGLRSPVVAEALRSASPGPPGGALLTDREHLVLARLAAGHTNPRIAADLCFSVATIRRESSSLYRKLGVRTRSEAVHRAHALGLLTTPPRV